MATFTDYWQPAATIAAALIQRTQPGTVLTPADAAKLYYEVVAALRSGAPSAPPASVAPLGI